MSTKAVIAVDGGGSKTDAAVVALDGTVLGRALGPGCSHHFLGVADAVAVISDVVTSALAQAGEVEVTAAHLYLTGIDMPEESELIAAGLRPLPWAPADLVVDNDVFALLRAGTDASDACVVVCGTGINGAAIRSDGENARILALGHISGDWGGGSGLVEEVLWHAARAEDGRGPETALHDALLRWTGAASVHELSVELHHGTYDMRSTWAQVPEIFDIALAGDAIARSIVERQADEIVVLAAALVRRLDLADSPIPLVLGGGIAASGDALLYARIEQKRTELLPQASIIVEQLPPVIGAALLALGETGNDPAIIATVRGHQW
jgi:N-acetylglucosamine kinase-like BadF-type ATPase